jgi:hypothetical protein
MKLILKNDQSANIAYALGVVKCNLVVDDSNVKLFCHVFYFVNACCLNQT